MKLDRISAYLRLARSIAKEYGTNPVWALCRLRYCWHRYGFDAKHFVLYGFYPQPLSAPGSYLRKREMESLQRHVNPREARDLVDDKLRFQQRCEQEGLPTPAILAQLDPVEASLPDTSVPRVATPHELLTLLDRCGPGKYLWKPSRGFLGAGITRFEFNRGALLDDDGKALDAAGFLDSLLGQQTSLILQPYLQPHPDLHPIMPGGCLGTARIVTINSDLGPRVLFACLKIPVGNNATDNFQSGRSGNLVGDVDLDTGKIGKAFGARSGFPGFIVRKTAHPETAEPLIGFQVPYWDSILETALDAARGFSELGTIGWDIALTDRGPSLIEGNARYGPDPHQVTAEHGLKDYFTRLLDSQGGETPIGVRGGTVPLEIPKS